MMRVFSSAVFTISLGGLMALYLVLGRQGLLPLHPAGMIAFAAALISQSVFAFIIRIHRLRRRSPHAVPVEGAADWKRAAGVFESVDEMLISRGFRSEGGEQGVAVYSRRSLSALVIEMAVYAMLVLVLLLGAINYAAGVSGSFTVAPTIEPIDLRSAVQDLHTGFLADLSGLDSRARVSALMNASSGKRSFIDIAITDINGKGIFTGMLTSGETFHLGNLRMRYEGDVFLLYLTVMKKDHDFLPSPLYLSYQEHQPVIYRGRLNLREPGASGDAEYDPATGMLAIRIFEKDRPVFDKRFAAADIATEGDFRVNVTASGHFGRFSFWRHSYRKQIIGGLGLLVLSLLARVVLRPSVVYVRFENGSILFATKDRAILKALSGR